MQYWRRRQRAGEGVRTVAAALGVTAWSLQRWIRASDARPRFRAVAVAPEPAPQRARLTLRFAHDGARVEGLDVESVAKLLVLVR